MTLALAHMGGDAVEQRWLFWIAPIIAPLLARWLDRPVLREEP